MSSRRQGFTLLEALIGVVIMAVVLGAGIVALDSGQRSFQQTVSKGIVNTDANRALNRIVKALTGARRTTLLITAEREAVSFQSAEAWDAGMAVWTDDVELRLEYEAGELDNGLDDDDDGLVDECQVVLTRNVGQPDEQVVILVKGVREFLEGEEPDGDDDNGNLLEDERGLCFERQGDALVIRLTLERVHPEAGTNIRTLETVVALRN
jgi:prepilin-type N-terminal cleavage/methylation domain-containing protein